MCKFNYFLNELFFLPLDENCNLKQRIERDDLARVFTQTRALEEGNQ